MKKYKFGKFNINLFLSFVFLALALFTRWTAIAMYFGILIWIILFERKFLKDKFILLYMLPTVLLALSILPTEIKNGFGSTLGDFKRFSASPLEIVCLPSPTNTIVEEFFPERCYKVPYYLSVIALLLFWSPIEFILASSFLVYCLVLLIKNKKFFISRDLLFILIIAVILLVSYSRLNARSHRDNVFMPFVSVFAGLSLFHIDRLKFGKFLNILLIIGMFIFTIYFLMQLNFTLLRDVGYYLKDITNQEDFIVGPMQTLFGYYSGRPVIFFDFRENELWLIENNVVDYLIFEEYYANMSLGNTTRKDFIEEHMTPNKTFYYNGKPGITIYQSRNPLTKQQKVYRNCMFSYNNPSYCQGIASRVV